MDSSFRTARLRAVWFLLIPFFYFASPSGRLLTVGLAVSAIGLWIRGWAAGHIRKDEELATSGPYAHVRNPLYVGSLLIGLGVLIAGDQPVFVALFLLFYLGLYGMSVREESIFLENRFGQTYRSYAEAVSAVVPRLTAYRSEVGSPVGFRWDRYGANREWEAGLGVVVGFAVLVGKMLWF